MRNPSRLLLPRADCRSGREGFLKGCFSKGAGFQQSPSTPAGIVLWPVSAYSAVLSHECPWYVWLYAAAMCLLKERRHEDMLQRLISEHVSKLPSQYDAILTSIIKLVLYMRYTNRSRPVKISDMSRENQNMRLTLEEMCNLLHNGQCKNLFWAGLTS